MASSSRSSQQHPDPVTQFRNHGGQLRLSAALKLGINRYQFYKLRDEGRKRKGKSSLKPR